MNLRSRVGVVCLLSLVAAAIGAELGAAAALKATRNDAASAEASGDYATAIALDKAVASKTGPLFALATDTSREAGASIPALTLKWAQRLALQGHVDAAVAELSTTQPTSATRAARSAILLAAAQAAHGRGDDVEALVELDELLADDGTGQSAITATALYGQYQISRAAALAAGGRAADAVTLLDAVVATPRSASAATAASLQIPATLLSAARQSLAASANGEALAFLNRLTKSYPSSVEASAGRALLAAPHAVIGTLATPGGGPSSGQIRLSTHFQSLPGGYYSSGPFYYSTAGSDGDFRFASVPVGGPYVLELLRSSGWTTLVDPTTGHPVNPVVVAPLADTDLGFIVLPG